MVAKQAQHQMREDKNFKGTDPSEITAQSLYCAYAQAVLANVVGSAHYVIAYKIVLGNYVCNCNV